MTRVSQTIRTLTMRKALANKHRLSREQRHEPFWQGRKKQFFLVVIVLAILLQLLFLGNMAYIYGSVWKSTERYHNFKVLYVDFDGGVVGQSVMAAYDQLKGPGFISLVPQSTAQYSTMDNIIDAVRRTDYWAAFIANPDASSRLASVLRGETSAQDYNASAALTYIWNEVRYPPFSDEIFEGSFEKLTIGARLAFNEFNGAAAFSLLNTNDPASLQVFLNPIESSSFNIMPINQQTKLFYNTVSMVMPILQQFFLILVLNGVSQELELYSKLPLHISGLVRVCLSVVFDFISALCMSGYIWAFRESWDVSGTQFVLTWMLLWLLMHIHYLIIDFATALLPLPALPFFLLTWIIINITSSLSPFEANPGFYKWGFALPANEAYTVLTDIWSNGSIPQLYRALPILFAWWILGIGLASCGHLYRCEKAWKQDAELQKLTNDVPEEEKGGKIAGHGQQAARTRTPSEILLQSAEKYREAYGPSVPPPVDLWRVFARSEQVASSANRNQLEESVRNQDGIFSTSGGEEQV